MEVSAEVREAIKGLLPDMEQFAKDFSDTEQSLEYARDIDEFESFSIHGYHWTILLNFLKGLL